MEPLGSAFATFSRPSTSANKQKLRQVTSTGQREEKLRDQCGSGPSIGRLLTWTDESDARRESRFEDRITRRSPHSCARVNAFSSRVIASRADERYLCFSLFMETVAHHHGYCIVAVASEEPYSATYHITKHDWCGHDAPVKGLCPGAYTSQAEALASAVKAATRYIDSQPNYSQLRIGGDAAPLADE